MGNQKIWEPIVITIAAAVALTGFWYLGAGPTNSKGKDGAEVIGDSVNDAIKTIKTSFSERGFKGGSATKRRRKHRRKSHKKR
jgi:hypothetical protein